MLKEGTAMKNLIRESCCSPEAACPPKPVLQTRPLLSLDQAGDLAGVFKVLANDTRLRLLHSLTRAGEMCVTDLADSVGMKPQAVSNQLQRLLEMGILASKREGSNIRYRIVDPCVTSILDQALCLMEDARQRQALPQQVQ